MAEGSRQVLIYFYRIYYTSDTFPPVLVVPTTSLADATSMGADAKTVGLFSHRGAGNICAVRMTQMTTD